MNYQFEFRCYQRTFKHPIQTNHGVWKLREGIIIRLEDPTGKVGFAEIAPLPWFGSETLESAVEFCRQLGHCINQSAIFSIPDCLPACQFAFESALESFKQQTPPHFHLEDYSALLPSGQSALTSWEALWQQGYRTFKWKIGVMPVAEEQAIFKHLIQQLPASIKLRLDANGGLNLETAKQWLDLCDHTSCIEFLEQPLPVDQLAAMLTLTYEYSTPIALDESVATLRQLQTSYQQGWQGIFVIKPSIAGSPSRLKRFCKTHAIDVVFSSVFETRIGRNAALTFAANLQNELVKGSHAITSRTLTSNSENIVSSPKMRALGFGIHHWFRDDRTSI